MHFKATLPRAENDDDVDSDGSALKIFVFISAASAAQNIESLKLKVK